MLINSYIKSNCTNGCVLFNDYSKYLYWENRKETMDEIDIVNFLNNTTIDDSLKILHIGIGNSFLALNLKKYRFIDGITISGNELELAKNLRLKNYNVTFLNKLIYNAFEQKNFKKYDIIIDVNLKSFSCCEKAFENLFLKYVSMLEPNGRIFTGKRGMNWSRIVKPVISFSIKKFFYKRLKEFDGPKNNILFINDCLLLSKKHNLHLKHDDNSNVVYFKN